MRYTKINPKAVSILRDKVRITQQELAARVGCSLSAVQFWEAGRSSPRGYRLRRLMELCPDDEVRNLFFTPPAASLSAPRLPAPKAPHHVEWEKRYLDPGFLRSLPHETRKLYSETVENILHLSALGVGGSEVAAEGLNSLAEAIKQAAALSKDDPASRRPRSGPAARAQESEPQAE